MIIQSTIKWDISRLDYLMKRFLFLLIILLVIVSFPFPSATIDNVDSYQLTIYTTSDGLLSDTVHEIAVDSEGAAWIGTDKGISVFNGKTWTNYPDVTHSFYTTICAIAIDNKGNKWFGANGGGVSKFDGKKWKYFYNEAYNANSLISNKVLSIAEDKNGNMWFGTEEGLSKFDGKKWHNYTTKNGLIDNYINSIVIDEYNSIWLGTRKGISCLENNTWCNLFFSQDQLFNMHSKIISDLFIDDQGNLWFTIGKGVFLLNYKIWQKNITGELILHSGSPVISMAIDQAGNKWFGTKGCGIISYDENGMQSYLCFEEQIIGTINDISIDKYGNKWFATNNGIIKWKSNIQLTKSTEHYDQTHKVLKTKRIKKMIN